MKILKIVLVIVAVVAGIFTLYNATLNKEYSVSRSTTMDVDPALVQQIVSDFSTWPEWSAWFLADSTMKYELGQLMLAKVQPTVGPVKILEAAQWKYCN